jgi:hypothetical protein
MGGFSFGGIHMEMSIGFDGGVPFEYRLRERGVCGSK